MSESQGSFCRHCNQALLHTVETNNDGEVFCCAGCLLVYETIQSNHWDFFYRLLEAQGRSAPQARVSPSYRSWLNGLDDAREREKIEVSSHSFSVVTLQSSDLNCSACGWFIENILHGKNGIKGFEIDFIRGYLKMKYAHDAFDLKSTLMELADFGYEFWPVTLLEKHENPSEKRFLMRVAVSAFCFLNIMMFSMGPYFGLFTGIDEAFRRYFEWVSFILCLPVVLFAATPFYERAWKALRAGRVHFDLPISLAVIMAFVLSTGQLFMDTGDVFFDSASGLVFFLLSGRWISQRFQWRLTLDPYWFEQISTDRIQRLDSDGFSWVAPSELKSDDEILLEKDQYLPVDGILLSDQGYFNTSLFTGESQISQRHHGEPIFSGFQCKKYPVKIRVVYEAGTTRIDILKERLRDLKEERRRTERNVEIFAPWFALTLFGLAIILFFVRIRTDCLVDTMKDVISLLIVACPCALALSVPLTSGIALKRLQKVGVHLKTGLLLFDLHRINAVLFDKTGTLTYAKRSIDAWQWDANVKGDDRNQLLKDIKTLSSMSLHPVSISIAESITESPHGDITDFNEQSGQGIYACVRGETLCIGSAKWLINDDASPWARMPVLVKRNETIVAGITMGDDVKPHLKEFLTNLHSHGIATYLLSGDQHENVTKLAKHYAFTGGVFSEMSPESKAALAQELKEKGLTTLAIGDGFNDALLLGEASVGIVVKGGVEPLSQNADVFTSGSNFRALSELWSTARDARRTVKQCYALSLSYNIIAVFLAFSGMITPLAAAIIMPLSTLSVCALAWSGLRKNKAIAPQSVEEDVA